MRAKLCRLQTQPCRTSNETTRSRRNSEGRSYDRQTGPAGHPVRVPRGMGGLARRTPCHLGWAVGEVRKKELGHREYSHAEALDVALCYGWIDGQAAKFDERYWLQRFTPRRARSKWSKVNREK